MKTSKRKNAYEMSRPAYTICDLRLDLFENTVNNPITKINNNNKIEVKSFFNKYKRCVGIKYSHPEINKCILQGG